MAVEVLQTARLVLAVQVAARMVALAEAMGQAPPQTRVAVEVARVTSTAVLELVVLAALAS